MEMSSVVLFKSSPMAKECGLQENTQLLFASGILCDSRLNCHQFGFSVWLDVVYVVFIL